MKSSVKNTLGALYRFFSVKRNSFLCLLMLIALIALAEYFIFGLARRTFVFYSALEDATIVEDRMLRGSASRETDIRRYVEEVLLGPESPDASPLFPRETRLLSLIFRDGTVYADFSEAAALPADQSAIMEGILPGASVFRSFLTLNEGIRRNFSSVKEVKLFIGGNEIFFNEFNGIFTDLADNSSKTGQKALTN